MSEYMLSDGTFLYYEDTGSGEIVVMLHGWASNHTVFTQPVKLLSAKARFITYDQRGHGGSKAANGKKATLELLASDLNELLEGLSLQNVTLLGWSMGAAAVLNYMNLYGCARLKQVVLCDMTPKKVNDDGWQLGLYQGEYTGKDALADNEKDCKTMVGEYALKADPKLQSAPSEALEAGLQKVLEQCDDKVVMDLFRSMNEHDDRACVKKITVPLTYFYAEPGSLYSPILRRWYGDNVNVPYRSVAFPDSTHMFITEHPQAFADALGKLL